MSNRFMTELFKIALASDHAGFSAKEALKGFLKAAGHEVFDFGCYSGESCDYADFAHPMASAVENHEYQYGFALCGSGNGINITVNKHQGIRAALCWKTELAALARQHNNANVCSVPARYLTTDEIFEIATVFLTTAFEGGRHALRVEKIPIKS